MDHLLCDRDESSEDDFSEEEEESEDEFAGEDDLRCDFSHTFWAMVLVGLPKLNLLGPGVAVRRVRIGRRRSNARHGTTRTGTVSSRTRTNAQTKRSIGSEEEASVV